jgi:membrane fusion protein (multidrug efflux system)
VRNQLPLTSVGYHKKIKGKIFIKKEQNQMKKIIILILMALPFTGCGPKKEEKETGTQFTVTSPIKKDTTVERKYVCQIHSIQHIDVKALERGYLQKVFVDEGQVVHKGQPMFQIVPNIYKADKHKAEAEVKFAEVEYKNTKILADKNIVSPNELALNKAKLDKAKAELESSNAHLGFTEIKAPFDGLMDRFHARIGSLLEEGDLLTVLSDNSKMWVYFNVPEAEYLDYKETSKDSTMKVQLEMANHKLFKFPGTIETVQADFNNETGNIAFRAGFENPDRLLRHGETGNIVMTVPYKDAILIPQKATFEVLDKKYVYIVDNNGVLKSKKLDIIAEMPDLYAVSGLNTKDKILLDGLRLVKENQRITYNYIKPEKVESSLSLHSE